MIKQKIILIESAQRSEGSPSAFSLPISNFPWASSSEYNRCTVLEAQFPKSFYHFDDDTTRTFTLDETTGSESFLITIAGNRNYSVSDLESTLGILMTSASAGGGNSFIYTVVFGGTDSGKFIFDNNGGAGGEFTLTMTTQPAKYLGFDVGVPVVSAGAAPPFIQSPNVIDLQRTGTVRIETNLCRNQNDDRLLNLFVGNTADFGIVEFMAEDTFRNSRILAKNNDNNFRFSIRDDEGNNLNLNNVNWRMRLVLYKE